ncbi:MAG: DUF2075 domain-containing protein [Clostridia bacterium]
MKRAYYSARIEDFLKQSSNYILGELTRNNQFDLNDLQRNTWLQEIVIMKNTLSNFREGTIIFEYTIPRIGSRIDVVLLYAGVAYLIEFKCGEYNYQNYEVEQVLDYALDLKNFHKASHYLTLVPILLATNALALRNVKQKYKDNIYVPIRCSAESFGYELNSLIRSFDVCDFDHKEWINSIYMPTPTIIEAAQALYRGHNVEEISRCEAVGDDNVAINLTKTTDAINAIIEDSKLNHKKSICFITGVPGAGKTLAGLNIANVRHNFAEDEHAVFLSGNGPLVDVLQEALARDQVAHSKQTIKKTEAMSKAKSFIQIIHHFRDDALTTTKAPIEKVAIFDEAQRAWNKEQTSKFMQTKKGVLNFWMSEPEFLISIMDRHKDWATIVCLVGGGQEINVGEAGLSEWFTALREKYSDWNVYLSDKIVDSEYVGNSDIFEMLGGINYQMQSELHLSVSLRSFRSEKVASFVKALLDIDANAKNIYDEVKWHYQIAVTRNLAEAKKWIKQQARGSERFGLIASSGAKRLKSDGIWVQSKCDAVNWFLNGKNDVRSSYYLEDTATEFDIQGLELDWTLLAWDADFRFEGGDFHYYNFNGTKWQNVNSESARKYLKNAYRVLLTRARQGMIIYVPKGDASDRTRPPAYYDQTFDYLVSLGLSEI